MLNDQINIIVETKFQNTINQLNVFKAWNPNNPFRIEFSSNLQQELQKSVEYCSKSEQNNGQKIDKTEQKVDKK